MVVLKKLFYVLVFSLSALQASTAMAALNVTVDRNPVNIEDTFEITIEATESINGEPELDKLKQNFDILRISQSSSRQISSSGTRYSFKRILTARAKQAGVITIPVLQWSKLTSSPLSLKVLPAGKRSSAVGSDFYVELSSSSDSPYVQGQVIITAKAFSNKQFGNGQFENPTMPEGIVAKRASSEDSIYTANINGTPYLVQERRFILYAERSGRVSIDNILFQGQFPTGRRSFFGNETIAKQARSNSLTLNIKAMPPTAQQPWLPAKQLTLSHYLSDGDFNVGEPITLTLSTIADGLMAEQIPDFDLQLPDNLKAYPDQPELDTNWSNGSVIAKRTDKIALIPTQPGRYEIPSIKLQWWNTQSDKAETAVIEGISFEVTGAAVITAPTSTAPSAESTQAVNDLNHLPSIPTPSNNPLWMYVSIVFASLWLTTLLILLWLIKRAPRKPKKVTEVNANTVTKKQLIKQLQGVQPTVAAEQLINWARSEIDRNINSIGQIMIYADTPLRAALEDLNTQLYRAEQGTWSSKTVIDALQSFELSETKQAEQDNKLSLYPE